MIRKIGLAGLTVAMMATSSFAGKSSATNTLTTAQKDSLLFIYQEEKVARDAYITLGKIYTKQSTFASIQLSEQTHIDKAQVLCETYKVDISNVDETNVGEYVVPVLQELYNTLIEDGSKSELDALKVGVFIEVTDIDDLEKAAIGMPNDVVRTYDNLRSGSLNHLDAFQAAINAYNAK